MLKVFSSVEMVRYAALTLELFLPSHNQAQLGRMKGQHSSSKPSYPSLKLACIAEAGLVLGP